ncbi:MAG: hypothetical protein ACKO8G_06895 [Actinomycetota bacterium]
MGAHLAPTLLAGLLAALLVLTGAASLVRGPVASGVILVLAGLLVGAAAPGSGVAAWRVPAAEAFAFVVLSSTLLREVVASARGGSPLEPWDDAPVRLDGAGGVSWASRRTRAATRTRSASPRSR